MRLALACAAAAACALAPARAQTPAAGPAWPDKPIKLVISFAPGGVHDTLARVLQPKLTEALGQPIVIENRPGARRQHRRRGGRQVRARRRHVPRRERGHRHQRVPLPRHGLRPLQAISRRWRSSPTIPMALIANPSVPAGNMKELIALAKAKPGSLSYGSAGVGASGHLAGELLNSAEGIDIVHVPYKGGAPALADLIAGRIQVMFLSISLPRRRRSRGGSRYWRSRAPKRSDKLPGVTTTAEQGYPEVQALLFSSLLAPAATPLPIIRRMNAEVVKALKRPEVEKRLDDLGAVPAPTTPEQFAAILKRDGEIWGKLIREKNIRAD